MLSEPLVYIIILNYNGYKDTIECIHSLKDIDYKNYKIVVVDNNSVDNSIEKIKNTFNEIVVLNTGINLGYAGGNNYGIKYALENKANYICVINNDVIVDRNFLKPLVDYMENNKNVGIVGPAVCEYYDKNIVQSTGAKINLAKGNVPLINYGKKYSNITKSKVIECDYISGACLLFRKDLVNEIGYIPESYFLFYEETEWCLKVKRRGYKVVCLPNSKIYHKGSASVKNISGLSEYLGFRNRVVFVKRNANIIQKIYFYNYLFLQFLYWSIFKRKKIYIFNYYLHGFFNKIDKKYSFCYIKK